MGAAAGDSGDSVRAALPGRHGQGVEIEALAGMEQLPFLATHSHA